MSHREGAALSRNITRYAACMARGMPPPSARKPPLVWHARGVSVKLFAALTALLWPVSAWACPNCVLGQQARAQVFGAGFGLNLVVAALPFWLIAVISHYLDHIDSEHLDSQTISRPPPLPARCKP